MAREIPGMPLVSVVLREISPTFDVPTELDEISVLLGVK
jgi:hypothetical protein